MPGAEHEGIAGVTFDSDGHRLLGRLYAHAGQPSSYAEIGGANHEFAWHRAGLRELVAGWLDETDA